ncbi:MAG TPA: Re/Si-specific NAD(P)(+) transhydrogenase subunit alpha [Bacteroides sp.]|nr:Re/Si-specific NAD(P)(+) transhydrogenase subunit alpha [Bacteroides sp.]
MTIGVLREDKHENRVCLLPEHLPSLTKKNISVLIESEAGKASFADDKQYEEAGAKIRSRSQILKEADVLLKLNVSADETLPEGKVLISLLNPLGNNALVKKLARTNVTSFSLDMIPRITRAQAVDILSSMATVAGYKAVLVAAVQLPGFFPMFMSASGTIKPSRVLILGAGVAGLQALATARKLGAVVEVFDVRSAVKEEVLSLGGKFVEVEGAVDDAAAGGYAVEQSEAYKQKQGELIQQRAMLSDVIITTAQIPGMKAPVLIRRETVEAMKPGSVIIDLAAATGGNCELTKKDETVVHNRVTIIGNSNFPSTMPADASKMLGKNMVNFLELMFDDEGNLNLDVEDEIVQQTCITRNGEIVHERIREK